MKLLIIGILWGVSFLLNSCGEGEVDKASYVIENLTNNGEQDLSIEKWNGGNSQIYNLKKNQTIEFESELFTGSCRINGNNKINENANYCLITMSDSLKIVWKDNKSVLFKRNDPRVTNVLKYENYTNSRNGNKNYYNYIFTEKDYLEAK